MLLPTRAQAQTQTAEFDDYHAMYEAVFSTLDDGYLATGILGERATPEQNPLPHSLATTTLRVVKQ